jgi:hypothetical protein
MLQKTDDGGEVLQKKGRLKMRLGMYWRELTTQGISFSYS